MSDTSADRVDARLNDLESRVGRVEDKLDSLNKRIDGVNDRLDNVNKRIDDRFDSLEDSIAQNRTERRQELIAIGAVVTAILGMLQLLVASGFV